MGKQGGLGGVFPLFVDLFPPLLYFYRIFYNRRDWLTNRDFVLNRLVIIDCCVGK
jgi:hypothetical protein